MSTLSDHCPEPEQLAAFVDGRLLVEERARVVEHLDACDACREVVAQAAAMVDEHELGARAGGQTATAFMPEARRRWWLYAAAPLAATALLVAVFWSGLGSDVGGPAPGELETETLIAGLVAGPGLGDRLENPARDWQDPLWSSTRGAGTATSDNERAFRLGAQLVALRVALESAEIERAESALAPIRRLFEAADILDLSTAIDELSVAISPPLDKARALEAVKALEIEMKEGSATSLAYFDLGRWAQAGRLTAMAENRGAFEQEALGGFARRWLRAEESARLEPLGPSAQRYLEAIDARLEGDLSPSEISRLEDDFEQLLRSSGVG